MREPSEDEIYYLGYSISEGQEICWSTICKDSYLCLFSPVIRGNLNYVSDTWSVWLGLVSVDRDSKWIQFSNCISCRMQSYVTSSSKLSAERMHGATHCENNAPILYNSKVWKRQGAGVLKVQSSGSQPSSCCDPHVMGTQDIKLSSLFLHNLICYWHNYNLNIWYVEYLICNPNGVMTHRLRTIEIRMVASNKD